MWKPCFPDVSQLISMVTLHIMMGSTMRPAPTASCPKTPPSSLTAGQRDDTFSSLVSLFSVSVSGQYFDILLCHLSLRFVLSPLASPRSPHLTPTFYFSGSPFKARTGTLEPSELETFKKQAECLNFLPEYHFGGTGQPSFFSALPLLGTQLNYQSKFSSRYFLHYSTTLLFQICVQMTGKLLHLLLRNQRTIKLMLSLLQSKAEHRGVKAPQTSGTYPTHPA